jgi:hypothetical protein
MRERTIAVIGRGAAGTSAARTLVDFGIGGRIPLIGETGIAPYNRTLVDKGLTAGLLTPGQMALPPVAGTELLLDTRNCTGHDARPAQVPHDDRPASGRSRSPRSREEP